MTSKPEANESELGDAFARLAPYKLPRVRVFRRQIVHGQMKAGYWAAAGIRGQCDYYAIELGGRHIEIEIKSAAESGNREVRQRQESWRMFCESWGILYLRPKARPGEPAADTVARWIEELRAALTAETPRA